MDPQAKLNALVEELGLLPDPQERMALVVDQARRAKALPPELRTEENRVPGCISVVWIAADLEAGCCRFRGEAESPLVRGLVVLLCEFFSGFPPEVVAAASVDPLEATGLTRHLSPTRRNGLASARAKIMGWARQKAAPGAS